MEELVEEFWRTVRMTPERAEELRSVLREGLADARAAAEVDRDLQQRRIQQLGEEREKLLEAYYGGAVPMDLLRSELVSVLEASGRVRWPRCSTAPNFRALAAHIGLQVLARMPIAMS